MTSATLIAEVIVRLARFTHGARHICGLTSAQWAALRYFARAIGPSRTVTAFADYHLTTRGTASQTVKSLVTKGLLARTRSEQDGRIIHIDLTDQGRATYKQDPFADLLQAIIDLPEVEQDNLDAILAPMMERISATRRVRCFTACRGCVHLSKPANLESDEKSYFCRRNQMVLTVADMDAICMDYAVTETSELDQVAVPR